MIVTFVIVVLITAYAFRVLNVERALEAGEIMKMVGGFIVFMLVTLVVLAGLMIGSGETDWNVIMPTAGIAILAVIVTGIATAGLKAVGRS
jgi:hypothetical protein